MPPSPRLSSASNSLRREVVYIPNDKPIGLGLKEKSANEIKSLRSDMSSSAKTTPNIVVPTNPNPTAQEYLLYLNCKIDSGGPRLAIRVMRLFENQFVRVDCAQLYTAEKLNRAQRQAKQKRIVIPQSLANREWYRWNATRIGALKIEDYPQGMLTDHSPIYAWDPEHRLWKFNEIITQDISCVLRLANGVNLSLKIHFDRSKPDHQAQLKFNIHPHSENRITVNSSDISGYILKRRRLCWNADVACAVVHVNVLHRSRGTTNLSSQESADEDETDVKDTHRLILTQSPPRLGIEDETIDGSVNSTDSETATSAASVARRRRKSERVRRVDDWNNIRGSFS
jgi:hypothetical protein